VQGLVAFCVLHPSANRALSTDPRALLEDLRARAAPEMTPSRILVVDALPLTANGKVDRAALLDRLAALRTHDGPGAADSVAKVLAEVFGLAQLDQDVNFFDAGATSLHLVRAHARLEQELGKRFPLQALFDHPRLRALSDFLTAANAGDLSPAPSPDRTRGSRQAAALRDARARRARPST
jgi:acyl carrier protein